MQRHCSYTIRMGWAIMGLKGTAGRMPRARARTRTIKKGADLAVDCVALLPGKKMAQSFLCNHPELQSFVLRNVLATGTVIGSGAYGTVEKVKIPGAECAAKKIHNIFLDSTTMSPSEIRKKSDEFVKECRIMSSLRHPNIVQFLGLHFFPGSEVPAIVMELLTTSLHDLIEPDPRPANPPYVPLGLKRSILHDVASGLACLHHHSPPIVHRDLSAANVLLSSSMVAKVADLGVARIFTDSHVAAAAAAKMTAAPGALLYMPPEAMEVTSTKDGKSISQYGISVDIFSLGVVVIFALSHSFPKNLLAPNYKENKKLIARSELERRDEYMKKIYSQLRKGHPFIQLIEKCLENDPEDRPDIDQVLQYLEQAKSEIPDGEHDQNKLELMQAVKKIQKTAQKEDETLKAEKVMLKKTNTTLRETKESQMKEQVSW